MTKNQQSNNTDKRGLNSEQMTKEIKFINNINDSSNKKVKTTQNNKEINKWIN